MTDKCEYCDEHKVRAEQLTHLKESDSFICQKIEKESVAREAQHGAIADALRLLGERIDRCTPRWAFLALLAILISTMGYGTVTLNQMNNKLSVFGEKLKHIEQEDKAMQYYRQFDRMDENGG
jgi:hypothetical protein